MIQMLGRIRELLSDVPFVPAADSFLLRAPLLDEGNSKAKREKRGTRLVDF